DQVPWLRPADVVPVPCHPDALAMAYALRSGDGVIPLTGLVPPEVLLDGPSNTITLERLPGVRDALVRVLSTGHSPESAASCLSDLLCCLPRIEVGELSYADVFRVLIVRFADAHDFDVRSIKKSCVMFAQPDGAMIPFETYNLFYRDRRDHVARMRRREPAAADGQNTA
ncbi:MAG TPA: radical SAM protein, partial [Myxococcota bacterium]|nr:radical SAM protein [Myxococcota bacterium]